MRIPILVLHCLILCLLVVVVSAQDLSTTSNNQQVTLFEKRKPSQNTCSCPGCDSLDVSFLFSIDVGCGPCGTGYYVSRMDLLVTPIADYHTYIIETTSTTGSEKVPVLSQTQLRYNLGECFSGSTSLFLDTLSYSTKLTCKNAITQCKANVKNLCTCSKAPSKLVIVLPSVIEAGSKYTPEVRIVDADGNIVPRSYTIQLVIGSSSSYISMAVDGVMKAKEQTAPSSGKITFRASISTIITPAPSLTGDYIEKEVSAPFTCFGISSSSSSVCSGKGTCTSQNQCTCYTGYTGNICETVSGTSGVSSISLSVPASVNTGSAFTATVSMLDSSGSTYPSGSGTITLDLVDSTGITYSGDKSKVAVNGAASFSVTLSTSTAKTISLKAVYNSFSDTKSVAISVEKKDYALSWVGSYKVVEGCNKDTCCCLSGQVSVSRIGDNSVQVNSAVVGNCGGTSLYSFSIDNINSDTVINTSAHGTTFVISKSGDELAVTNQQASQCSGRALKSQGTMSVLNYFTILVTLVVVILLNY